MMPRGFWPRGFEIGELGKLRLRRLAFAAAMMGVLAAAVPARAAEDPAQAANPAFITVGAGAAGIIADRDKAGIFHFEYRSDLELWRIRPFVGVAATTDASVYGYFGLGLDIFLGKHWVLTPNTAVGLYEEGDGQDLGHVVEFRSGLEVAYRFDDQSRLGLALHHLSNASIGDENPGTETLILTYSLPLTTFSRQE